MWQEVCILIADHKLEVRFLHNSSAKNSLLQIGLFALFILLFNHYQLDKYNFTNSTVISLYNQINIIIEKESIKTNKVYFNSFYIFFLVEKPKKVSFIIFNKNT
jgi:hypothetical protein